jgi:hypothetical protein
VSTLIKKTFGSSILPNCGMILRTALKKWALQVGEIGLRLHTHEKVEYSWVKSTCNITPTPSFTAMIAASRRAKPLFRFHESVERLLSFRANLYLLRSSK